MKAIYLSLLLGCSITLTAQDVVQIATAPDLIVIKSKLRSIAQVDTSRADPPPAIDESPLFKSNSPSYEWQGEAELEVKNTGTKGIKSIEWAFFLVIETKTGKTVRSYYLQSKKAIKPGQTVTVTHWFKDAYLKELRNHLREGLLRGQAEIKRINYADGRVWVPLIIRPKQSK